MTPMILITGSSGFLGSRIAQHLADKHELLLPTHDQLNISREAAVQAYIDKYHPHTVIHCAALSNTWYCEQHPQDSHRVNVQGTVKLAKACKKTGAKLIFMSSDQVYNGTPIPGPLSEEAPLQPINVYGRHKLEAEQRAIINHPSSVGLRLTWMYDLPCSQMKLNNNILVNLQKAYKEKTAIKVATHEYRGVTNVWEVVRNIEKAITLPGGIYNFGSANTLDSHTLFIEAARQMRLPSPTDWILPDTTRYSEQHRNLSMNCSKIEKYGIYFNDSIKGIEEALTKSTISNL